MIVRVLPVVEAYVDMVPVAVASDATQIAPERTVAVTVPFARVVVAPTFPELLTVRAPLMPVAPDRVVTPDWVSVPEFVMAPLASTPNCSVVPAVKPLMNCVLLKLYNPPTGC